LAGGHSVAIKASILEILDINGEYYSKIDLVKTGLTELEYDKRHGWKLISMND